MCEPATIAVAVAATAAVASSYAAYQGAQSSKAAAKYERDVQQQNSKLQEWQAQDAEKRGAVTEARYAEQAAAAAGSRRAALAASGVDIASGSAFDLQEDVKAAGSRDLQTIRENVAREAFGYRIGALDSQASATLANFQAQSISPTQNAAVSALGGASNVADTWYRTKKT